MTYQDLLIQNRQQSQQLEEKSQLIDTLQFEIANLKKLIFGARRERFTGNADAATQSTLFDIEASPNIEQPETVTKTIIIKKRKKPKTFKRKSFPAHLPREEKTIQPEDIKADAAAYTKIGESITELLKYHPAHLTVKKIIRPKYIMKNDEDAGVKQALVPPRLIPGGIVDESLIAGLITEKILHHTPVHRFNKKLYLFRLGFGLFYIWILCLDNSKNLCIVELWRYFLKKYKCKSLCQKVQNLA